MRGRERERELSPPFWNVREASRANSPSIPLFLVETTPAPPLSTRTPESPHGRPHASFSARWEAAAEEEQEAATVPDGGAAWLRPARPPSSAPFPSFPLHEHDEERGEKGGDGESQRAPPPAK